METPVAVELSGFVPVDQKLALPRLPKLIWQWRPAVLSRRGNRVEASGLGGSVVRLGTAFWGSSSDNVIRVGRNFSTRGVTVRVAGQGNRVEIGESVRFSGSIQVRGFGLTVRIGDRCDFKRSEIVAFFADVEVGSDCLVATGVQLRSGDFHTIIDRSSGSPVNSPQPVTIGSHVWLGARATLLKGAHVPDGCVVGWGSIVTRRFEERDCVLVGSPARTVRRGISWSR